MIANQSNWPEVSFGDIFDISSSKRVLERQWKPAGVPFYRAREIVKLARDGYVDNELFISEELYQELARRFGVPKPGDLMVSAVGTLGACYQVRSSDRFYFKDASVLRFHPKMKVCPEFFEHAFLHHTIRNQVKSGSGSTVGTLTIARANEIRIKLPPLDEQRRIAAILDKADELRRKRRRALEMLDTLTTSIFLELFGDPKHAPYKWPFLDFNGACRDVTSQSAKLQRSAYSKVGLYPVVDQGQSFVAGWASDKDQVTTVERPIVIFGDHTRVVKYVDFDFVVGADGAKVLEPTSAYNPLFFSELLRLMPIPDLGYSRHMRALKELKFLCPPLKLQDEFAETLRCVQDHRKRNKCSLEMFDSLFASLQSRAFSDWL